MCNYVCIFWVVWFLNIYLFVTFFILLFVQQVIKIKNRLLIIFSTSQWIQISPKDTLDSRTEKEQLSTDE